jgi:hypothetical protein
LICTILIIPDYRADFVCFMKAIYCNFLSINGRKTTRLYVLKIMGLPKNIHLKVSEQTINPDVIIACIDTFLRRRIK